MIRLITILAVALVITNVNGIRIPKTHAIKQDSVTFSNHLKYDSRQTTSGPAPVAMTLSLFNSSSAGKCLDGSPAGYYYALSETASTRWIIRLQGGGLCVHPSQCKSRTTTALGSSKYWPESQTFSNSILSTNCTENPDFCNDNHVYVPYCSGDLWSGTHVSNGSSSDFYFSGHTIVELLIPELKDVRGMLTATDVILTGSSAGGIGTFVNANWVKDNVAPARLTAVPMAGWFISMEPTFTGGPGLQYSMAVLKTLYDAYIDPQCSAANKDNDWVCYLGKWAYPTLEMPVFVSEMQFDSQQLVVEDHLQGTDAKAQSFVQKFGTQMRGELSVISTNATSTNGIFAPSCYGHGVDWSAVLVNGVNWQQSLGAWYNNRTAAPHKVFDPACTSKLPCNPTCETFPPTTDVEMDQTFPVMTHEMWDEVQQYLHTVRGM